jgi:hypothetical protein
MTCRDIAKLLAESTPLPAAAAGHLRTCERCRLLAASPAPYSGPASIDAGLEQRLIDMVTSDLAPVHLLSPPWVYTAALLVLAAVVAAAGVALLGMRGWHATSIFQKLYFLTLLTAGIAACAASLSQFMFPGALPRIRSWILGAVALAAVVGGGALYPLLRYDHFARAVATCFTIGMAHAAILCTAAVFILRRGLVLSRRAAAALAGLLGGFTGLTVLFVFCPHLDAGHYLLAHATVVIACAALGPAIVAVMDRLAPGS